MIKYTNHDIVFQEFPDEVTLAINLSLCPNACPGCHSPYLAGDIGEVLTTDVLDALMEKYKGSITCIGLMGGDNDPAEVVRLVRHIRSHGLKAGWYSGRQELPVLAADEGSSAFPVEAFSYIKLGPYVEALGPLKERTTNQRLFRIDNDGQLENITQRFWR